MKRIFMISALITVVLSGYTQQIREKVLGPQGFYAIRNNHIIMEGLSNDNSDSLLKEHYSAICNTYIQAYHAQKVIPSIRIATTGETACSRRYIAGWMGGNGVKFGVKKFDEDGIFIAVPLGMELGNLLILLDYALTHTKEIKRVSKRLRRIHKFSERDDPYLSKILIRKILNKGNFRVSNFLNLYSLTGF